MSDLARIYADRETMRFIGPGNPISRTQTAAWIEWAARYFDEHGFAPYAVVERSSGALVGRGGFIRRPHWRRSYPTAV